MNAGVGDQQLLRTSKIKGVNPHFSESSVRVRRSQPGLGLGFDEPCTQGQTPPAAHLALIIRELEVKVGSSLFVVTAADQMVGQPGSNGRSGSSSI